jgi:Cys-tRNA(Pro) deacylase
MSRTPADVQQALHNAGLAIEVITYDESTRTAQQAADAVGCELGQIVKSLCFTVEGAPILILTAGDQRVDTRKVAGLYDVGRKRVKIASPEVTLEATGFKPGGVAPVAHATPLPVLIDETLTRYTTVYAAAGSAYSVFPIGVDDLKRITAGRLADIAE